MKTIKKTFSINGKQIKKYFNTDEEKEKWLSMIRIENNDASLEGEQWKSIPLFSRYEASNMGRLRSLNYKNSGCVKIIHPAINSKGYLQTMLQNDSGGYNTIAIHYCITLAWFGEREKLKQVNHIDGIKTNNKIDNLEYVTGSENMLHSFRLGLEKPMKGEDNPKAKLTWDIVAFLRNEKKTKGRFWGRNEYAKIYNVNPSHLKRLVNKSDIWKLD